MGFCTGFDGLNVASLVSGHREKNEMQIYYINKIIRNGDHEINKPDIINPNSDR